MFILEPTLIKVKLMVCLFRRFGIGLFIYQSLDAIDGKQARRTQTSGPLGELFDHGKERIREREYKSQLNQNI